MDVKSLTLLSHSLSQTAISAPVEYSFPSFSTKLETIGWDDIHARDATCHRLLHEARDPCAASTTYRKVESSASISPPEAVVSLDGRYD